MPESTHSLSNEFCKQTRTVTERSDFLFLPLFHDHFVTLYKVKYVKSVFFCAKVLYFKRFLIEINTFIIKKYTLFMQTSLKNIKLLLSRYALLQTKNFIEIKILKKHLYASYFHYKTRKSINFH